VPSDTAANDALGKLPVVQHWWAICVTIMVSENGRSKTTPRSVSLSRRIAMYDGCRQRDSSSGCTRMSSIEASLTSAPRHLDFLRGIGTDVLHAHAARAIGTGARDAAAGDPRGLQLRQAAGRVPKAVNDTVKQSQSLHIYGWMLHNLCPTLRFHSSSAGSFHFVLLDKTR